MDKSKTFILFIFGMFEDYEDVMRRIGSAEKAELLLQWKAKVPFREGLQKTCEWHQKTNSLSQ